MHSKFQLIKDPEFNFFFFMIPKKTRIVCFICGLYFLEEHILINIYLLISISNLNVNRKFKKTDFVFYFSLNFLIKQSNHFLECIYLKCINLSLI